MKEVLIGRQYSSPRFPYLLHFKANHWRVLRSRLEAIDKTFEPRVT